MTPTCPCGATTRPSPARHDASLVWLRWRLALLT